MTMRARAAVAVVAAGLLAVAGCSGSSAQGRGSKGAADAAAAPHHATRIVGEQVVRAPVAVTPYERQAFLEMAMSFAALARDPVAVESGRAHHDQDQSADQVFELLQEAGRSCLFGELLLLNIANVLA